MKGLVIFILLANLFLSCKETDDIGCEKSTCTIEAKVVDMTGLDGCGLMFELADGTRLEPERRVYVQAPGIDDDPLYYFDLKEGQVVKINWIESTDLASICMAGPIVFITCITECKKPTN